MKKEILWLFDLDNTLHDTSHAIFPAITANMNAFLTNTLQQENLPADPASVDSLRLNYWQRYGATLLGMMRHHAIRMDDFLHAAHQFDDLIEMIRAERGVRHFLKRLPGRKILLTNAPHTYSRQVVRHLGLQHHFSRHIAIESMHVHGNLRPKPSRHLLKKILAREKVRPQQTVLVEDTVTNLKAAKALGIRTVWVTQYLSAASLRQDGIASPTSSQSRHRPSYVDVRIRSVRQLYKLADRLAI